MSPTTEQLRSRMARELDELGPMPDVSRTAAREGARVLRRRRLAAGSLIGVAGVGACSLLGAVAAGALPGSDGRVADDPTPSPVPSVGPTQAPIRELLPTVPPYPSGPIRSLLPSPVPSASTGVLPSTAPRPTPTSASPVLPTPSPPAPTPTAVPTTPPSVAPTSRPPAPTPTPAPTNR